LGGIYSALDTEALEKDKIMAAQKIAKKTAQQTLPAAFAAYNFANNANLHDEPIDFDSPMDATNLNVVEIETADIKPTIRMNEVRVKSLQTAECSTKALQKFKPKIEKEQIATVISAPETDGCQGYRRGFLFKRAQPANLYAVWRFCAP
jgi:hypothetical protein